MSKSKKKPIVTINGYLKKDYWKTVRRTHKYEIRSKMLNEDFNLTDPKSIINDYDYIDYKSNCENMTLNLLRSYKYLNLEYIKSLKRK
jgi:hypothetical protein